MKILITSHNFHPFIGGIEVMSEFLAFTFFQAGHEVRILTWSQDPEGRGFPFEIIRRPSSFELVKQHIWADIVLENNPALRLSWPQILFSKPSVIVLHTWIARSNGSTKLQDFVKKLWLKRANKVIAASDALRKGCFPSAVVIRNPYQENNFMISGDVSRTSDFIFLGRLVEDKGVDLAIKAIHRLKVLNFKNRKIKNTFTLTIVGEGPLKERLEDLVSELKIEDQVTFTGPLRGKNLNTCLNRHRFLLVPSVWDEPFGIVALEGIASGCIPIVSDCGGLPEAIGKAGVTFCKGNLDDLVRCIVEMLDNTKLQKKLLIEGKKHIKSYSSVVVAPKYLEVVERFLIK